MSFESEMLRKAAVVLEKRARKLTNRANEMNAHARLMAASADEIELRDAHIRELESARPIIFTDIADTEPYRTLLNRPIWGDIDLDELNGNDG